MTVSECYALIGGDYQDVFSRLMKDERILKYLTKFLDDREIDRLSPALAEGAWEEAFRITHNLKGVSLNLGLTPLAVSASALCEELRGGKPAIDVSGMLADVHAAYQKVTDGIRQLIA